MATLTKGYPVALGLLLAALYPRRFAHRFAGALALGLALPFAAQSPAVVTANYASWLKHLDDSTTIMRERLRSVDHLFVLYGEPLTSRTFLRAQLAAGLFALGLCLVHVRRTADRRQQLVVTFLLFSAWVVLFGPATESCTYVVIAPAIAWAVVDAFARGAAWPKRLVLLASLLMMGPLTTDMAGQTIRNFANEHGSQPLGGLLFLAIILSMVGRLQKVTESDKTARYKEPIQYAA